MSPVSELVSHMSPVTELVSHMSPVTELVSHMSSLSFSSLNVSCKLVIILLWLLLHWVLPAPRLAVDVVTFKPSVFQKNDTTIKGIDNYFFVAPR